MIHFDREKLHYLEMIRENFMAYARTEDSEFKQNMQWYSHTLKKMEAEKYKYNELLKPYEPANA